MAQLTNTALNSLGLELKCFFNSIVGLIVMGVCLWFLPALIGVYALAVAQTAFFLVTFAANLIVLAKHHYTDTAYVKPFLKLSLGAVLIVGAGTLMRRWLADVNLLVSTLVTGATVGLLYVALVLGTKSFDVHVIFNLLRKRKR